MDRSLSIERVEALTRRASEPPDAPLPARPIGVLYGGAHLFSADAPAKLAVRARGAMDAWGRDDDAFGRAVGVTEPGLAREVAARVRTKLASPAVESMCIDFEDGYGPRPDDEEDADAVRTADELARLARGHAGAATRIGLRIKALAPATIGRAIRTLDLFVSTLLRGGGALPAGFTVTLPKVRRTEDVALLVETLEALEAATGASPIGIELMIETPSTLVDRAGAIAARSLAAAGGSRVVAVHLGAYDLTAELGVTAGDQRLDHPLCDLARMLLVVGLAGTGVAVSDGATTVLPIPPKGTAADAAAAEVHRAWSLHATGVRRAIEVGIWQGWDLHPAQLPARYGAVFAYFLERRVALAERLRGFVERATQATRLGGVFDDAATGQGLLSFFLRGLACGALDTDDRAATTLTVAELERRSFAAIVAARAG